MAAPAPLPVPGQPDGSPLEPIPDRPASDRRVLAALTAHIARIAANPGSRDTAAATLDAALEIFGAQIGAIWMSCDASGDLTLIESSAACGGNLTLLPRRIRRNEAGVTAAVARTRTPLCLCRPEELEKHHPAEEWFRGLSSVLCVPLLARDRLLGIMLFAARRPHAFDADDVALAAALGQLAAPASGRAARDGDADPLHTGARGAMVCAEAPAPAGPALAASLDLDEVLTFLVERAATATGADAVGVLEADAASGVLRFRRTYGLSPGYSQGLVMPVGSGIAGAVLVSGRPLWTADILTDPRFSIPDAMRSLITAEQVRGILAVPIRGREAFYGVLTLYWRVHRTFGDEGIAVAAQIAEQAAIAIENARLFKAKTELARQQAALLEIGATLNTAITQEGTFQLIIDKALETLGADKGTLFAYDPAAQELSIVAARGLSAEGMGFRLRMGESAAGRAILWRRPVLVPDVEADTEHDIAMDHVHREGMRALLILPLVTGDEVVGAISLARSQPTRFSEEDIALLTLFAHQAAVALRNAGLFEDLARSHAQVAKYKEQLQELYRLGVAMQSAISLRERLDLILQGVHGVLGLDRIAIFLCDRDEQVLECRAALGEMEEPVEQIKLPLGPGGGILARVFREGQELLWSDEREVPADLRLGPPYSDFRTLRSRSFIILPLVSRGGTIGLLVADNKLSRGPFSDETLSLLRTFAAQAAIAIENAGLFDRQREAAAGAERQRAQAEALAAVGQAISASLDLDEVLSLLVERTAAATGAYAVAVLERETPTGALRFRKAHGLSHRYLEGLIFSSPAGVSVTALSGGRAQCTADVLADPSFTYPPETRARMAAEGIRGLLSVPIRGGDGPYGVLNLYWQDPHPCTEEEITFAARIADQAAIAIENARLFQREQERRRQVEAVRAVSEEITRELDLATVLNLINLRATDLLRAAAGTVWLWNEADQALAPRAWQGYGEWLGDQRRRLGEAVVGAVALRREGLILNEFRAWPHASRAILERSPVAKVAAEPLLYRERLIGVIIVDRLEGEASFTEEDRKLLALFAAQAAVAIENARLFQQEQERRRQVEAVRAVTEEITRELDLPALLGLIHRRAMELVGASSGCIHLWDEAAQVLLPKAWHGLGDWMQEVRFRLGEGISGVVAQRREGLIVNDYRGWPQASPLFLERTGVTATLAEPLLYRDKLIGVITVDSREADRTFTEKDRELLGLFAAQAAIAIENARLYQEVRDRARDLGILIRSGQTVTASLALPHILQTIADAAVAMTGAPEANLVLADEGGGLGWQASAGPLRQAFAQEREARPMPPGRGFAAQVVARGESLWVPDLAADPEDFYRDFNARHGLRCYLGVPIRARERVLGVLNITGPADGSVSQRQGELLESLAAQAAIAIENARLFQQELERRRQLEAVRAVTEEITRELNLSSLLTLIQRRATELVGAASGAIFLWDEDAQALVPKAWHGLGDFMQDVRLGPGESITGLVAQRRQGMIVNDYRVWPSASPIWLEHTGMTAVVAEPLLYRDRLLGVITINNEGTGQRFTEQDRQTLALFAAQAAIAIENARLYAQTREALDELEAIHEAGRAIAQSLDLQETLRHILAAAMRLTDTDKGIVTLLDEERQELVGIAFAGVTGHSEVRVPLSEHSFAVACFRAGHVLTTDHPETDPRCSPALQARFGNKALIAVPLLSGDRVIGVFDVGDLKRQRQFTPRQIAILERLAQHAVVAIENARLYAETRKAYEDLRAAQEQLVRVEKLKALGELSAGVAHDFNNLLAAILGRAQLLRMRSTDPQLRQGLEVIERAALDGAETVRRILGFARAGSEAEYAPVDLAALIPQVLEVTRPRWKDEAQQRGAAIEAELVLEPAPAVRGNAAELREVLVNLVFNAVDAMPHGGRLTVGTRRLWRPGPAGDAVNPHLEVLADQRDEVRELVEIFVRDTGVGMSESVRRRAFDPFFTSKGVKGSGLGLSVVYGIVSRHGGEVILESQEGAGTTVAIRLPATTRTPAEAGEPALSPAPRAGRIVVLDDEEVLAQTLADVLRLQRHQVEVFTEPRAALAHLAGASADLFFTDLGMPEMSGWDVAQEARRIHPQLPIVLVTGWGHQIDPAQVRECRVNALVSKPYRVQDIMRVVAEILPARPAP